MVTIFKATAGVVLALATTTVAAAPVTINFADMADNVYGESAWNPLDVISPEFKLSITAQKTGVSDPLAYLDFSNAGLGVCGYASAANTNPDPIPGPGSGTNVCIDANDNSASGDDNVTEGESLLFAFSDFDDPLASLDVTFFFNSNHDSGIPADKNVNINGDSTVDLITGNVVTLTGGVGIFSVMQGQTISVAWADQQFYVGGMLINNGPSTTTGVPEPATLALMGLGLAGIGYGRRQLKKA